MSSDKMEHAEKDVSAVLHEEDVVDQDFATLNTIEDTQTSKVVWLIAICVSVGGFLFGESRYSSQTRAIRSHCSFQATIRDISPACSLQSVMILDTSFLPANKSSSPRLQVEGL